MPFVIPAARSALVRIQSKTETNRDPQNRPIYEWGTFVEAWVQISPVKGIEKEARGIERSNSYFTMAGDFYGLKGVTNNMRVAYDEDGTFDDPARIAYFDIEAVMADFALREETVLRVRLTVEEAAGL